MKKKERDSIVFEKEWEREREKDREVICKMRNERGRACVCIKMVVVRNNKKIEKNEYFIEISCKIDKLM